MRLLRTGWFRLHWRELTFAGLVILAACVFPCGQRRAAAPAPLLVTRGAAPEPDAGVASDAGRDGGALGVVASVFPHYPGHADDEEPVVLDIENVERLEYYYGKLFATELGRAGAVARASHWGDSVIGGDGMTEAIRRRLQARFGDAGHGFHAVGKYSRWYSHRGVRFKERREWDTCLIIFKCRADARYGYGGVTSSSSGGALSRWETSEDDFGRAVSRFELWYEKRPDGGKFEIRVDGQAARVVDSRSPERSDEVETVWLEDGPHAIEVAARGGGVARAYGVVLERDGPGAVWDELSMIGSFTQRLDFQDAEHIAGQVRRRDVDLMVFILGGNDLMRERTDLKHDTERYEEEYGRVVRKLRAGKPEAACLIMALTDHARRVNGVIVPRLMVERLAIAQRKVAAREGCAFYDTFLATGGHGTIERWRKAKPPLASPDLRHPTVAGQRLVGNMLYVALMKGYADYRRRLAGTPLPAAMLR